MVLGYRQHSAIDPEKGVYYILLQPTTETKFNVSSVGPPLLYSIGIDATPPVPLRIQLQLKGGGGAVPPLESIEFASEGSLLGVGRKGEVYAIAINATSGTVEQLATLWEPPALLTAGLTAFDPSTRTLYAVSQQPVPWAAVRVRACCCCCHCKAMPLYMTLSPRTALAAHATGPRLRQHARRGQLPRVLLRAPASSDGGCGGLQLNQRRRRTGATAGPACSF
jgi:hypothetical protein